MNHNRPLQFTGSIADFLNPHFQFTFANSIPYNIKPVNKELLWKKVVAPV
jgi:hypothetical protein